MSKELGDASRQTPSKHRPGTCDHDVCSLAKRLQMETPPPPPPGHLITKPEEEASDDPGGRSSTTAAKRLLFDEADAPDPSIVEPDQEESDIHLLSQLEKDIDAILVALYNVDVDTADYMHDPPASPAPSTEDRPSRLPGRHAYTVYLPKL
ncbi:unnamed protein product [Urochloa humidicola]